MEVDPEVQSAYGKRADEYAAVLGAVDQMHPDDSDHIRIWGRRIVGPVLDIGCGPGHWTDFLHRAGADIRGVDPVPEFTAYARGEFPGVDFRTASLNSTGADTAALAGVLCWYSLIHIPPQQMGFSLTQIHRLLRPGASSWSGSSATHAQTASSMPSPRPIDGPWTISPVSSTLPTSPSAISTSEQIPTHGRTLLSERSSPACAEWTQLRKAPVCRREPLRAPRSSPVRS